VLPERKVHGIFVIKSETLDYVYRNAEEYEFIPTFKTAVNIFIEVYPEGRLETIEEVDAFVLRAIIYSAIYFCDACENLPTSEVFDITANKAKEVALKALHDGLPQKYICDTLDYSIDFYGIDGVSYHLGNPADYIEQIRNYDPEKDKCEL